MDDTAAGQWVAINDTLQAWYVAPDDGKSHPLIIIYIEAFGVTEHLQAVAERFAHTGFCAAVIDIYHGRVFDYRNLDAALGAIKTLDEAQVMAETRATIDALGARPECDARHVACVGFCMGGRLAFKAHADLADIVSASVCFYGGGIAPDNDRFGRPPLLKTTHNMRAPLLLFYGGEDGSIQPAEHARISQALSEARLRYALHVFPEAGHAFFCDARQSYHACAAQQAWEIMHAFLAHAFFG